MLRPEAGASHSGLKLSLHPSRIFLAYPRGCPTPCVLLGRMNTFIELFFHALLFIAVLSTGLLIAELRDARPR